MAENVPFDAYFKIETLLNLPIFLKPESQVILRLL